MRSLILPFICLVSASSTLAQLPVAPSPNIVETRQRQVAQQVQYVQPAPVIQYAQPAPVVQYAPAPVQYIQPRQVVQQQVGGAVCPNCGRVHGPGQQQQQFGGLLPGEINRNSAAYAHARREATILAQQGDRYPTRRDGGHPLGPGGFGRRGGTGVSMGSQPNHCYDNRPQSEIVARAAVRGTWRGRPALFWSAILR
jgi:hypothetical protein